MANNRTVNVVAALTTGVALLGLYLFLQASPPGVDRRPHLELGRVLAAEAVKAMESGTRLIVLCRDREPFKVPAAEAQLEGFMEAIKKSGKTAATFRRFKQDPLRVVGVPPGEFFDLIRLGREDDVIVSFLGPPVLRDEQLQKLGAKRARVLAVCSGAMPSQVNLRRLFEQKLLQTAVVSRRDAPPAGGQNAPTFAHLFQVITSANLSELSEWAAKE